MIDLTEEQAVTIRTAYNYGKLTDVDENTDTFIRVLREVWGPDRLWLFRTFAHTLSGDLADLKGDLNRAMYSGEVEKLALEQCPELWSQLLNEGEAAEVERERVGALSPEELVAEFVDVLKQAEQSGTEIVVLT